MMRKIAGVVLCIIGLIHFIDGTLRICTLGPRLNQIGAFVLGPLFLAGGVWLFRFKSDFDIRALKTELVTVATYSVSMPAELAKMFLQENGIQAFITDANTVTADWFLGPALGWIKLQVAQDDAVAAKAFLESHPNLLRTSNLPSATENENDGRCLACGAAMDEQTRKCATCGWSYTATDAADNDEPAVSAPSNASAAEGK